MDQLDKKAAWNLFLQTGRVEDYLQYAKTQGVVTAADPEEDSAPHGENDHGRNRDRFT